MQMKYWVYGGIGVLVFLILTSKTNTKPSNIIDLRDTDNLKIAKLQSNTAVAVKQLDNVGKQIDSNTAIKISDTQASVLNRQSDYNYQLGILAARNAANNILAVSQTNREQIMQQGFSDLGNVYSASSQNISRLFSEAYSARKQAQIAQAQTQAQVDVAKIQAETAQEQSDNSLISSIIQGVGAIGGTIASLYTGGVAGPLVMGAANTAANSIKK
jgi:hypothetical protein